MNQDDRGGGRERGGCRRMEGIQHVCSTASDITSSTNNIVLSSTTSCMRSGRMGVLERQRGGH